MSDNKVLKLADIDNKYKKLIKLGIMLDDELYRNIDAKKILNNSKNFFKHMLQMNASSIEAYHTFSTIIIIVFGFQGKKITENNYMNFKVENFIIAAVENIIDLVHHQSQNYNNKYPIKNRNLAIKLSKYIDRVLKCVEKANKVSKKNIFKIDKNDIINVNKVILYRNNSEKLNIKDYNNSINYVIDKFNLNKKMTFSSINPLFKKLFAYLGISLDIK